MTHWFDLNQVEEKLGFELFTLVFEFKSIISTVQHYRGK